MTDDLKDQQSDHDVQDVFAVHRQQLRQAMENSVESMRRALIDQQEMYAQFKQGMPPGTNVDREADPMEPITADFVSKAYRQAQELFEELRRKMIDPQSVSSSPGSGLPEQDERTGQMIGDAHAATDLMMSQATSHLSAAMKAIVEAMESQSTLPGPSIRLPDAATPPQTRTL